MSFFESGDISLIFQKPSFPVPAKGPSLSAVQPLSKWGETAEGWEEVSGLHNSFLEAFKWVADEASASTVRGVEWDAQNLETSSSIYDWEHIGNDPTDQESGPRLFSDAEFTERNVETALESSRKMLLAFKAVFDDPDRFIAEMKEKKTDYQNLATLSLIFRTGKKGGIVDGYKNTSKSLLEKIDEKVDGLGDGNEKTLWEKIQSDFKEVSRDVRSYMGSEQKIQNAFDKVFDSYNLKRIGRQLGYSNYNASSFTKYFRDKNKYTEKKLEVMETQKQEATSAAKKQEEKKAYFAKQEKLALQKKAAGLKAAQPKARKKEGS